MEDKIKEILAKYNETHNAVKCVFEEDMLSDIFKLTMNDLESNRKISTGVFVQCIELSTMSIDDLITHVLDDMYLKLKKVA